MTAFSNNIKLIILTWLMTFLSAVNCKRDTVTLNCTIAYAPNPNQTAFANPKIIPGISSCPESYKNESIIKKCERFVNNEDPFDTELFTPITNNVTNVTYWNEYCASCNNDNAPKWKLWPSWRLYRDRDHWCEKLTPRLQRSEIDDIPELIKIFVNQGGLILRTRMLFDRELNCSTEGNWPIHLIHAIIPCVMHEFYPSHSVRLFPCQYIEKSGKICTSMKIYTEGFIRYRFANGNKIDYNETLSDVTFASDQYAVETSNPEMFYICEKTATIYGNAHTAKIIISIISLIFIIAFLGIHLNKRYFQNMVNKMLYAYMIGLILMGAILLLAYLSYPVPCVAFYLAKLLYFYHFFWTMLIYIEYCSKYHCKCDNCFTSDASLSRRKNYAFYIYSALGLIIPLTLAFTYYYGVLVVDENYKEDITQMESSIRSESTPYTCPAVPGHSGVTCIPYQDSEAKNHANSIESMLTPSFYFFIPALLVFILAFGLNHFTKCCSDKEGPVETTKRDHMIVLIKMGSIMAVHWVLYKIYVKFGGNYSSTIFGLSLDTICQFSIDFHGILVFILFEIENYANLLGYKRKSVSQQDNNHDAGITQLSYPLSTQTQINPTQTN